MADVPTTEPRELRAGMTWQWRREDLTDYPASTWTLTYWFKKTGDSGANFSVVATADGVDFAVSVAVATTTNRTPGDYTWVAVVSGGGEAFEVDRGTCKVLARYDQAANVDDRTDAREIYEALVGAYKTYAAGGPFRQSYAIGTRQMQFQTPTEMLKAIEFWKREVAKEEAAERIANGQAGGGRLLARI